MTMDDFLLRLDAVRRTPRGYLARCPAHEDKSPSLSIREGNDGRLLIHCFAGCTVEEITGTLGLRISDLFNGTHPTGGKQRTPKNPRLDRGALAFHYELAALDRTLRAERVLTAIRHHDNSVLTDETREQLMKAVASTKRDLEYANLFAHVADTLRWKAYAERTISHAA